MSSKKETFDVQIIDFNPSRMAQDQATEIGIPDELKPLLADKRQYLLNIARQLPKGSVWFRANQPWFFRTLLGNVENAKAINNNDALILSGSGMSMYKFQEGDPSAFSAEDKEALDRGEAAVRNELGEGKWVFGICFGGQLAVHAVGGKIGRLPENSYGQTVTEAGWLAQELTEAGKQDKIFGRLPETFYAPHLHSDYVAELPKVGTQVQTARGEIVVIAADTLAVRRGYLDENGLQQQDSTFIQASKITFSNGAVLYQIQPHPEMATEEKGNFLVRQNPWVKEEMGQAYYDRAVQMPQSADFSVSQTITRFIEEAREYYEANGAVEFARFVVGQNIDQFAPYLLK